MRTIDGTRYISARECAEIMDKTAGWVSQNKAQLPFVRLEEFGIDAINFDLLELQEHEKAFAQSKFETTNSLHQYTYKDLGNFFSKFAMDLVQFKGNADLRINELFEKNNLLVQEKAVLEKEKNEVLLREKELSEKLKETDFQLQTEYANNEELFQKFELKTTQHEDLVNEYQLLAKNYEDAKIVQNESKHDLEIKIIENKNLLAENESLKVRLNALEISIETEAKFRTEFNAFKELVMEKLK